MMIDIGLADDTTSMLLSSKGNVPILRRIFKYIGPLVAGFFFLPHFHPLLLTSMKTNQKTAKNEQASAREREGETQKITQ